MMSCQQTGWARIGLAVTACVFLAANASAQGPAVTKNHELLKKDLGVWNAKIKMWVAGPEADPIEADGVETNTLLGEGLWVISKFEGNFGGVDFLGRAIMGYDPLKKKFVGTWVDTMSPHVSSMEGTYDEKTDTFTFFSDGIDPASGEKMKGKSTSSYADDGSRLMTMYNQLPGSDKFVKMMEIRYTKKK